MCNVCEPVDPSTQQMHTAVNGCLTADDGTMSLSPHIHAHSQPYSLTPTLPLTYSLTHSLTDVAAWRFKDAFLEQNSIHQAHFVQPLPLPSPL